MMCSLQQNFSEALAAVRKYKEAGDRVHAWLCATEVLWKPFLD